MSVGVVVPVYYGRSYLAETLASIQQQTYQGAISVVVVEDGTELALASEDIVRPFGFTYLYQSQNRGVMGARRYGASRLPDTVRYVALLDQDDRWDAEFLSVMTGVLDQDPHTAFAASNVRLVGDESGRPLWSGRQPSLSLDDLKVMNQIISPSQVLIRYDSWREATHRFHANLRGGADDWLLWLSLLALGHRAQYVPNLLVDYRVHRAGAHNQVEAMRHSQREVVEAWFPKLGFSVEDQRRFYGRQAFDGLMEGLKDRDWMRFFQSLGRSAQDPWAVVQGFKFRWSHKRRGLV